jgi:hypothetical protein
MTTSLASLALPMFLLLAGCASAPAASPAVPSYFVDEEASELSFRLASGGDLQPETAKGVRPLVKDFLNEMIERRSGGVGSAPARFKADIVFDQGKGWFVLAPCLLVGIYFGCPMGTMTHKVDLTFEVGGQRYHGSAEVERYYGLYYSGLQSLADATAQALEEAVANAKKVSAP